MSEEIIIIVVLAIIAISIIVWILYLAAGLVLVFTAFVMGLPIILSIIMFILFPPTLIVFLVGLAFIQFGVADVMAGSNSGNSREMEKEKERRRALGYDE